jgi:pSer/pThr/pTyr-binding forkhead associated (FHA) protein
LKSGILASQLEYQLTVLNGPDKGAAYRLIARKVTIGRGNECDIILREDNKVSRTHAQIEVANGIVEISDISDRNRVIVNGDDTARQALKNNAVIQLGETKLQFKLLDLSAQAPGVPSQKNSLAMASPRNELNITSGPADFLKKQMGGLKQKNRRPGGKPSLIPMIVILGVLAGLGYFMADDKGPKKEVSKFGSEKEVERNYASVESELTLIEEERKKIGMSEEEFTQVQAHYVKGFRDYNNGQYERASESFKACLAMMPTHPNCQQFFNDSERQFAQVINEQMKLGQRYKNQNQYSACFNAFNNVKISVKIPTDLRFKEADVNAKFCQKKMEDRF